MDPNGTFDIGRRNILAVKKILWQKNLGAINEDLGNDYSRTVNVETKSGRVTISSPKLGVWEL